MRPEYHNAKMRCIRLYKNKEYGLDPGRLTLLNPMRRLDIVLSSDIPMSLGHLVELSWVSRFQKDSYNM